MLIDSLFLLAPMTELPLLDRSARLDMLDYYAAGLPANGTNTMGGKSLLTQKNDSTLNIRLTDVSDWTLTVLPDRTLLCTHTLHLPELPDRITARRYDAQWQPLDKYSTIAARIIARRNLQVIGGFCSLDSL